MCSAELLREILAQHTSQAIKILEDLIIRGRELGQFVTDFIWYLRNLLLISASDNPEEAVDVSRENLERMKEECQMVDTETLMRSISGSFLSCPMKSAMRPRHV